MCAVELIWACLFDNNSNTIGNNYL
jgi:hypothetical protein